MVWRSVGCGLVGGAVSAWLVIANIDRLGDEPFSLLLWLALPLGWWGTRFAHNWRQGAFLGLITIGTPVTSFLGFVAYVSFGWAGGLDRDFTRIAVTQFGPTLLVGTIVGTLTGAINNKKLSSL